MSNFKKLMVSAAGGGLDVDDVFSTYLFEGNGSAYGSVSQTITNGIDHAGEGGI